MSRPGASLGRWRLLSEAARGGAGAVWRGAGPDGAPVAIKLLHGGALSSAHQRERFGREVQALLRLRHPGVVALLDAGEHRGDLRAEGGAASAPKPWEQGVPYLVQEWVEGETLASRLEREGRLDPRAAAELVGRLADALEHCHQRGVLHRDLKPSNVLLRAGTSAPLLTDFGLARDLGASQTEALTRSGVAMGTPGWWPPEQVRFDPARIGPRSDVYGLGALLHGCLTGRRPHAGETIAELLTALTRPPTPPSQLVPGVPAALDEVCLRCLALDPEARYPSAAAVAAELTAWLSGRRRTSRRVAQVALRPGAPASPPARTARAAAAGLLLLGLGGGAGLLLLRGVAPPRGSGAPGHPSGATGGTAPAPSQAAPQADPEPDWPGVDPRVRADLAEGLRLHHLGDRTGALAAYDRALRLVPDQPLVLYNRGVARQELGDLPGALRDFERALELDPSYFPALLHRGLSHQGLGHLDQAQADFEAVIARAPEVAQAWNDRGMLRYLRGDLHGALADFDRALELLDSDPRQWANRGTVRMLTGDLAGAAADYDRALALAPGEPGFWVNRAAVRRRAGDVTGAFQDYERALTLDPGFAQGWYNRGNAREELGDLQGALADYEQAIQVSAGTFAAAFCARGALAQGRGEYAAAVLDFERALALQPDDAVSLYNRGLCRLGLGDEAAAIPDLERAAALQPGAEWAPNAAAEAARLRARAGH